MFSQMLAWRRLLTLCMGCGMLIPGSPAAGTDWRTVAHYSESYAEARGKFVDAAWTAGGQVESHLNPHGGADGSPLYTDVSGFNLTGAHTVLVLISGTHGVEGFAGSAIQTGLLREGIAEQLPEQVGLLVYHAMNPYGFSSLRRFNEGNVDLNRNFVDHDTPYPVNAEYERIAGLMEPGNLSAWSDFQATMGIAWYRLTKGAKWLQAAVSRGQYAFPQGLFYGGHGMSWSNRTLRDVVKRDLSAASRVIVLDFHTGLGAYAALEVITESEADDPGHVWLSNCWGLQLVNPKSGSSVSPSVNGSLKHGLQKMLPGTDLTAVTMEFGTYSPKDIFWSLRAENYLHHHGDMEPSEARAIKDRVKQMFYPDDALWKDKVWKTGASLVRRTLSCLR